MNAVVDTVSRDRRLLLLSVWASAAFAVLSSVWGVLSGSSMIVFDGLYSFASIGLSLLAVLALRTSRRGADERQHYQFAPFAVTGGAAGQAKADVGLTLTESAHSKRSGGLLTYRMRLTNAGPSTAIGLTSMPYKQCDTTSRRAVRVASGDGSSSPVRIEASLRAMR